jgi:WNK lysine deficient protein kinase
MDVRWVDPSNRYVCMGERIGTGANKSVYRAFDRHEGREVAWCKARLSGLEPGGSADIAKEIAVMTSLDHPHIVRLVSSWTDVVRRRWCS